MIQVKANTSVTSVTVTMSDEEASRLRAILQQTILWQEEGVLGSLAGDIDNSLELLDIPASPVQLKFSVAHGMFVEEEPS